MGGQGSGRKPDVLNLQNRQTSYFQEADAEQIIIPNLSGVKNEIKTGTSNISTDDLSQGSVNLYSQWANNGDNIYYNDGNVGIGNTNPAAALHVSDKVLIGGTTLKYGNQYKIQVTGTDKGIYIGMPGLPTDANSNNAFGVGLIGEAYTRGLFYSNGTYGIGGGAAARDVFIGRSAVNTIQIGSNYNLTGNADFIVTGNVGIGTTSPSEALEVSGSVKAMGYKSSDGSAGITQTIVFNDADATEHTLVFKNGLLTSYTTA